MHYTEIQGVLILPVPTLIEFLLIKKSYHGTMPLRCLLYLFKGEAEATVSDDDRNDDDDDEGKIHIAA